jgi:hypothetical protein
VKTPVGRSVLSAADFVCNDEWGVGRVTIRKRVLKILNHAPWSIWPDLPPTRKGISRGGDLPGYNHKRGFVISVAEAEGKPVPNAAVGIRHDYQQGTGGHVHGASNDLTPDQSLQGIFWSHGESGYCLDLTTDANGMAYVDSLVASEISGMYLITAYLVSDPSVKDTVNLTVQVPGLVSFHDLIFLPNNERPYTFEQTSKYAPNHPDNDWCQPAMGNNFFAGILNFNSWSGSKEGGGVPIKISINDMRLPWGGAFDYEGTWNVIRRHAFHRVGLSVDINRNGMSDAQIWILSNFMKVHGGLRNPEEPIHYGFFNGGYRNE